MNEFEVRAATIVDQASIERLIRSPGVKWFGNIRPKFHAADSLFNCYQTQRMVAYTKGTDKAAAYAELRTYPSISSLPSDCWMEWLSVRYCLPMAISWLNCLFFNFCIYKSENPELIAEILKEVFYLENRATFIITVRTPSVSQAVHYVEQFDDLEKISSIYYPREYSVISNMNTQSLYIVSRFEILSVVNYRKALPEDNDDIMGILEEEIPGTYEEFGDYYIAEELLRSEDNSNNSDILVVAETLNVRQETEMAIFMWLTTDIDIRFYVRNYEMSSFGNLVKFDPNAPFHYDTLTVASVHRRAAVSMFTAGALEDLDNMTILGGLQRNDSGMSVASAGKMKISSIGGAVDDAQVFEDNKFYIREALYTKFTLIIEKLLSVDFYLRKDTETINFIYNTGNLPSGAQAIQAASNVFMVKYCLAEKTFPMPRLFNAVVAMFCAYPDKDYGMMVLSNKARNIRSHVELMQYFMPVASRPSAETNLDEVFITHRSTIFGEISLYKLRREDVSVVLGLASSNMDDPKPGTGSQGSSVSYCSKVNENLDTENELDVLRAIMKEVLDTNFSQFSVFTIRVGNSTKSAKENTPVGFVVLRQFHDHNKLHDHYYLPKLEAHLDRLRAQIISLRIHPLFMGSADLIFRDLAKKTNFYDFYSITSNSDQMLSNDLKKMMMVLEPRHVKKSPTLFKPHKEPKRATTYVELRNHNYAKDHLIIYRHKLNPVKWFTNTNKIVILGFSSVAKAFLRQLIFLWNSKDQKNMDSYTCLTRVQVTLICEPGIVEAEYDNLFQCPYCSQSRKCYLSYSNRSCFIRDCCYRMDLRHWVHFIPGKVQAINRANKLVKLEGACEITYDTLFLCCDQNFVLQSPNESIENTPCNFVEINSRLAKFMLFYKVRALLEEMPRSYMILIYGDNLSVYECIGFLMNHGVDCSRIVFVKPHRFIGFSEEDKMKNPFWDKNIQLILDDMLGNNGLEIIEDHAFKHWVLRESTDFIMQVVFQHFPSRKHTSFECDLFISFGEGHMVPRHKQIFEASSIQLDNNYIVINEKFQTNDPNIYAAGRFVKIMPEPNYQYKYTSAREVAVKLLHHLGISPRADFDLRYELPYHFQAMLPLNYFITKVVLPVRYLSIQPVGSLKCSLTTYKNQTFCRVGLNNSMLVDEIVVVTKKEAHFDFLQHFVGKHEMLLNNLRARYRAKTIDNFLQFFQEPWTELIMHDKFPELQAENRELLRPMALAMLARTNVFNAFYDVTDMDYITLNRRYLEQKLLAFLRENRRDFKYKFALPEDFLKTSLPMWARKEEDEEEEAEMAERLD